MRFVYGTEVRCPSAQRGKVSALQITPALLYFRKLNLTFTVHRGSLFFGTLGITPSTSNRMWKGTPSRASQRGLFN
jgi:hypothetical protein